MNFSYSLKLRASLLSYPLESSSQYFDFYGLNSLLVSGRVKFVVLRKKLLFTGPPWPKIRVLLHEDEKWASFCRWNKSKKCCFRRTFCRIGIHLPGSAETFRQRDLIWWIKRVNVLSTFQANIFQIRNQETFFSAISVVWTVLTNSSINWNKQTQHSGKFTNLEMDFPLPHFSVPESPKFTQENLGIQEPC